MNWNFLITFGIGLGVYFVGLTLWTLFKRYRNKKKFDKDVKEHIEQNQEGNDDEQE